MGSSQSIRKDYFNEWFHQKKTFWHDCDWPHDNSSEKMQNVGFFWPIVTGPATILLPVGFIFRNLSHGFLRHLTETTPTFVFTSIPTSTPKKTTWKQPPSPIETGKAPKATILCCRNSKSQWPTCFGKALEFHHSYLKGLKAKTSIYYWFIIQMFGVYSS